MTRNETQVLFFYEDNRELNADDRILSNFFPSPITIDIPSKLDKEGIPTVDSESLGTFTFPTAEHLFQALKFSQRGDTPFRNLIVNVNPEFLALTAINTKEYTRARRIRNDWHNDETGHPYKLNAMKFVLRAKYNQN